MPPTTITNVSELTKEIIADLYFRSLGNPDSRRNNHAGLTGARTGPSAVAPSVHDIEMDFGCWYGGLLSLAYALDDDSKLPKTTEMTSYISPQFDRVKSAIAA
jgi:hypothetical protein